MLTEMDPSSESDSKHQMHKQQGGLDESQLQ